MKEIIIFFMIIGAIVLCLLGTISALLILLYLFDKLFSSWIKTTKKTVWFFDYLRNRRQYQIWLDEKKRRSKIEANIIQYRDGTSNTRW